MKSSTFSPLQQNITHSCRQIEEIQREINGLELQLKLIISAKRIIENRRMMHVVYYFSKSQYVSLSSSSRIDEWLGFKETIHKKDTAKSKSSKIIHSRRTNDKFVIEGDEDEIRFIENMRNVNDDDDDALEYNYEAIDDVEAVDDHTPIDDDDGFQVQKQEKKRQRRNIQIELQKKECMSREDAENVTDVWSLGNDDRWRLYRFWVKLCVEQLMNEINNERSYYRMLYDQFKKAKEERDFEAVKDKLIIGMTTTGAAKYRHIIDRMQPKIISE